MTSAKDVDLQLMLQVALDTPDPFTSLTRVPVRM